MRLCPRCSFVGREGMQRHSPRSRRLHEHASPWRRWIARTARWCQRGASAGNTVAREAGSAGRRTSSRTLKDRRLTLAQPRPHALRPRRLRGVSILLGERSRTRFFFSYFIRYSEHLLFPPGTPSISFLYNYSKVLKLYFTGTNMHKPKKSKLDNLFFRYSVFIQAYSTKACSSY